MAAFAPPVQRDRFLYSSVLYADAGNDNHHARASVAELTALLRPEAPKGKGKQTKVLVANEPATDRPWHFWTAQLIHYGLASTKDKNAAKVRLLSALNENRLETPRWVVRLEAEMKTEWEVQNKKLRKTTKETTTSRSAASKKTATTPRSSQVNISINVELSNSAPAQSSATAPATPQSTTSKRKRDNLEPSNTLTPAKKPKSRVKKEETVETKPSIFPEHLTGPIAGSGEDDIVLSGIYNVVLDYIEFPAINPYTDIGFQIIVLTEEATGIWWAKFHWAMFDGIIKMDTGPTYETITHFHTLGWRIRNEVTGRLTFGRNCTGQIRFDATTRTLEGTLFDVPEAGRIDFQGDRLSGPRRAGGLSSEWDRFVRDAYGRTR